MYLRFLGVLSLKKQIDYETLPPEANPIVLSLAAGGDVKNGSVAVLNITVVDENDNPPAFERKVSLTRSKI